MILIFSLLFNQWAYCNNIENNENFVFILNYNKYKTLIVFIIYNTLSVALNLFNCG